MLNERNNALVTEAEKSKQVKPWLFAICMGLIGAAINSIPFPLLPEIQLILGNAAFVFVAMHLLPRYTLVTAFITLIPVYFIFGHPWGFLTFGLEALFISTMRTKGWYVLIADMAYWLLIGMPLTYAIIWFQVPEFTNAELFIVFKQGFNGLWYTSIACFFMFVFNEKLKINWDHQSSTHRSLRAKMMYSMVFVTTSALFTSTLLISNHFIQTSKVLVAKSLEDSSQHISDIIEQYIQRNQKGLEFSSEWLSAVPSEYFDFILDRIKKNYPDFNELYLADFEGKIQHSIVAADKNPNGILPSILVSAKFGIEQEPDKYKSSPAFSNALKDQMPVVALSSPFTSIRATKQNFILEGVLDLTKLKKLTPAKVGELSVSTIIVDQKNNIICASPELNLTDLNQFNYQLIENRTDALVISADNKHYIYKVTETANGWKVYSLIDHLASTNNIKNEYLSIFIILFFTLILTAYFADLYGQRLAKPIKFIIDQLTKESQKKMSSSISASTEVIQLYEEIINNRDKLYQYQERLEENVAERTKELNEANVQLEKLALLDGLTQVHNRRYLDDNFSIIQKSADRNTALMSLIMVDLDYFKKLNDSHGHLIGDNCLIKVAQLIKKAFDRDTDMVVRFGGEEFVVVAPYITPTALAMKIEKLRETIETTVFNNGDNELFTITASFGAVIAEASFSHDVLKWVKIADECLYEAKDAGRNCFRISDKIARTD